MSEPERCYSCRYFYKLGDKDGACRRYPPPEADGIFPSMDSDEWCGEWLSKPIELSAEPTFGKIRDVKPSFLITSAPEPPKMSYRQWLIGQVLAGGLKTSDSVMVLVDNCVNIEESTRVKVNK